MKKIQLLALSIIFAAFCAFSTVVVLNHGYTGFIDLALADQWGMQVFLDLVISLMLFTGWMLPDAKQRGITVWPYMALILSLGSIGALAYVIHRTIKELAPAGDRDVLIATQLEKS